MFTKLTRRYLQAAFESALALGDVGALEQLLKELGFDALAALRQAELMDGNLILATNVMDLTPPEVVQRYKALADIERGFRVLKSKGEIALVLHRLPVRSRPHAFVFFLALIVYRQSRSQISLPSARSTPKYCRL